MKKQFNERATDAELTRDEIPGTWKFLCTATEYSIYRDGEHLIKLFPAQRDENGAFIKRVFRTLKPMQ